MTAADANGADPAPTQDDISRIIRIIETRDERVKSAEAELRSLRDDLYRLGEENRRLREDLLPMVRMVKDRNAPLPTPNDFMTSPPNDQQDNKSGGLARKFSTKKLFLSSAPKNPSPTIPEGRITDSSNLDPSAAAMAASSHLTASIGGSQPSPNALPQSSPTSPAYSTNQQGPGSGGRSERSFPRDRPHDDYSTNTWSSSASTIIDRDRDRGVTPAPLSSRAMRNTASTLSQDSPDPPLSGGSSITGSASPPRPAPTPTTASSRDTSASGGSSNPQVEIFKSFRVSIDDPCHKVLPVALKKYNITADWRQYALYIVHGDQERCLGLNERPLILFKQLDREGRKPMFMLRKHAQPVEGHVSTVGRGETGGGVVGLPGGVL